MSEVERIRYKALVDVDSRGMFTMTDSLIKLTIPNREIRWVFEEQVREWFEAETRKDRQKLEDFCRAFEEND